MYQSLFFWERVLWRENRFPKRYDSTRRIRCIESVFTRKRPAMSQKTSSPLVEGRRVQYSVIPYLRCSWVYLGSPVSFCMSTRTLFHASCGSRKSESLRSVEWFSFRTNVSEVTLELILPAIHCSCSCFSTNSPQTIIIRVSFVLKPMLQFKSVRKMVPELPN